MNNDTNYNAAEVQSRPVGEILERISDAFVALDKNWCYTYMNKKAGEIFNRNPGQMIGRHIWTEFPEGVGQSFHLAYEKAMQEQHYIHLEEYYPPYDKWFENHIYPSPEGLSIFFKDITERKKAEEAIRLSEEKYRTLVEQADDGIFIADGNGRFLTVNTRGQELCGYSMDELSQMTIYDMALAEDLRRHPFHLQDLKEGKTVITERPMRAKNGTVADVEINAKLLTDGRMLVFVRDITEKKKAAEVLNQSRLFIENLLNTSPDIIYIYDIEERKNIYINQGIQKNLGYTDDEIKAMGDRVLPLLLHPDDFNYYLQHTYPKYAGLQDKELLIHEFRMRDKQGRWHWLYCKECIYLRKPDGTPKQIFGITTDITERKIAEEKVKEQASLITALSDNLPDTMIYQVMRQPDGKMKFTYVSKAVQELTGKTPEEAVADPSILYHLIVEQDREKIAKAEAESFSNMSVFNVEVRCRTAAGEIRWLNIRSTPRRMPDGGVIWDGVHTDITERKKAEERLAEREQQLRLFVQYSPVAIAMFDREMNYIVYSKQWITDFQLNNSDLTGKSHYDVFPELPERWKEVHRRCLAGASEKRNMELIVRADGNTEWVRWEIHPWYNVSGEVGGIIQLSEIITEKVKAQQEILRAKELLERAEEQAGMGSWELDLKTNTRKWSRQMFCLFGFEITEQPPPVESLMERIHPDDRNNFLLSVNNMIEGVPASEPAGFRTNPEMLPLRHFSFRWFAEKDGAGNVIKYSGTVLDITERIKAEEELRLNQERFTIIFKKAPYIAVLTNAADGKIAEVNEAFEKLFGYSRHEVIGKTTLDLGIYPFPEEREKIMPLFREKGYLRHAELKLRIKNGEMRDFLANADIVEIGGEKYILTVNEDITEKKIAQEQFFREKELSDEIINSLPGVFYFYTQEGKFLRWNKNVEIITGYSSAEIKNMHPLDFFDDQEKPLLAEKIRKVFTGGEDNTEANFLTKTGTKIPYYFTGRTIDYEGHPCLVGVGIDISERVKAQQELKDAVEKLRQLSAHLQSIREEERKRIGREIHDELGQQLTAIKMDVAWIDKNTEAKNTAIKDKLKNTISLLDGSNLSIRKILNELRLGILEHQQLDEALQWQGKQFSENTGIPFLFRCNSPEIKADETTASCLFRVFQEALTNITRYAKAKKVKASLQQNDDSIRLIIEDDGEGFDINELKNKKSFGLLGMQERITSLNGTFDLQSAPGRGTKITVIIPLQKK